MMIAGNMFGIPLSAFQSRQRGRPFKKSSVGYELGMVIGGILILPISLTHSLLRKFTHRPNVKFG